jgi:hypothetical protein
MNPIVLFAQRFRPMKECPRVRAALLRLLVLSVCVASACAPPHETPTLTPAPTAAQRAAAPPVTPMLLAEPVPPRDGAGRIAPPAPPPMPETNPLTGLPAAAPAGQPLLVKVSNAPPIVRPQAGLAAADVVFEHYAEAGLTRFSAVFLSSFPARVGSVRSARLIDDSLTVMFGARLVFSGASVGVDGVLTNAPYAPALFRAIAFPEPYTWRDEAIDVPHNLFVNAAAIAALGPAGPLSPLSGWAFDAAAPAGPPARVLGIRYATTRADWAYDPASGGYLRFTDGLPHLDANTGAQLRADNVLVVHARHRLSDIVESMWGDVPTYSLQIDLETDGPLLLARDGVWQAGYWVRPPDGGLMRLITPDGRPLALRPGTTWVQVLPLREQMNLNIEAVTVAG